MYITVFTFSRLLKNSSSTHQSFLINAKFLECPCYICQVICIKYIKLLLKSVDWNTHQLKPYSPEKNKQLTSVPSKGINHRHVYFVQTHYKYVHRNTNLCLIPTSLNIINLCTRLSDSCELRYRNNLSQCFHKYFNGWLNIHATYY